MSILAALGGLTLVALVSIFTLLRPTLPDAKIEERFSNLLSPALNLTEADFELTPTDTVTLTYESLKVSTRSSSLLRPLSPDESLFLPSFRPIGFVPEDQFSLNQQKLMYTWDEDKVRTWITNFSSQIETGSRPPKITYDQSGITIFPGEAGIGLDVENAINQLFRQTHLSAVISGRPTAVNPPLTPDEIKDLKQRATRLTSSALKFTAQEKTFTLTPKQIAELIFLPTGFSQEKIQQVVSGWASEFKLDTVEPTLGFEGKKIINFQAPVVGRELNIEESKRLVLATLELLEETGSTQPQELVSLTKEPKISLESLNNLGITERIGRGSSDYAHSIPNRVFNVSHATSKLHGIVIQPGESFSFVKALGDISAATGYKQAYVISQGQTILGDGGGVCQVSSTLFRAILDAGLPILERKGHSYRVGYYEQNSKPGFDATISSPHPDLVFLNDTKAPILINAQADSKKLHMYIELYGQSDGRKAEILDYKQWGQTPAPPPLYQDDPSLPRGVVKQVEYAAGGLKTSFRYQVTYPDGTIKNNTYLTSYVPWRAVFLNGTRD